MKHTSVTEKLTEKKKRYCELNHRRENGTIIYQELKEFNELCNELYGNSDTSKPSQNGYTFFSVTHTPSQTPRI